MRQNLMLFDNRSRANLTACALMSSMVTAYPQALQMAPSKSDMSFGWALSLSVSSPHFGQGNLMVESAMFAPL